MIFIIVFLYILYIILFLCAFILNPFIQIKSILLTNFKNVNSGSVDFKNNILGVYGQNGSGKTALIDALEMFQMVAGGATLPQSFKNLITYGTEFAECSILFDFFNSEGEIESNVEYTFRIQQSQEKGVEIVYEQITEKKMGKQKKVIVCFDKSQEKHGLLLFQTGNLHSPLKNHPSSLKCLKK